MALGNRPSVASGYMFNCTWADVAPEAFRVVFAVGVCIREHTSDFKMEELLGEFEYKYW